MVMIPPFLIERRLMVDRAVIRRYADITQDYNPIHLDPEFAAKTPMRGVIAYGTLSLNLIWQSLTASLGVDNIAGIALDVRFVRPVRENDLVISGGSRKDDIGLYEVWVRAEGEGRTETVITGTATLDGVMREQGESTWRRQ